MKGGSDFLQPLSPLLSRKREVKPTYLYYLKILVSLFLIMFCFFSLYQLYRLSQHSKSLFNQSLLLLGLFNPLTFQFQIIIWV
jgi:hypothetical protein